MTQRMIQDSATASSGVNVNVVPLELGCPSLAARLQALTFSARFDRQVEAGAAVTPGSPLAAHIIRLLSIKEREDIASSFRRILTDYASVRISLLTQRIEECRDLIDDITLRLHSPRPVAAQGMARLRMILSNGSGPLYFQASANSLAAELRSALKAL